MSCSQTRLSACWGSVFGFEALEMKPLGSWIKDAWSYTSKSSYLDLTAEYTFESMLALRQSQHTGWKQTRVYLVRQKALHSLQAGINSSPTNEQSYLTISVMLHYAAEVRHLPSKLRFAS